MTEIQGDDSPDPIRHFHPKRRKEDIFERLYNRSKKKVQVIEQDPEPLKMIKKEWEKHRAQSKMNDKDARKYRMHEFIYEKKKQDKLKYNESAKLNNSALPVPKGSLSIMLNTNKKNYTLGLNNTDTNKQISIKARFKMKWKTVQWLMINKADSVQNLLKNFQLLYTKFCKSADNPSYKLNSQEFKDLLSYSGIGGDSDLIEKLFLIFDDTKSGYINYRELLVSLEIFRDS